MFATVPREVIRLRFPFNSSSFMVSNSSKMWHPCVKSFCLVILAKLAFKTVGVLGVPTSLRDLRILDLGVSAIISVMNLLFVGVGGHLSSLSPSLVFNELTWSTAVPNMNWSSGVQTYIEQTKEITTLQLLIVRWEWCNNVWNADQLVAIAAENWLGCHVYPYAHKHEVPCHRGDSLNALHNAFTLELDMSNSSLQIH